MDGGIYGFAKTLDELGMSFLYSGCEIVEEFKTSGRSIYAATDFCKVEEIEQRQEEWEQKLDSSIKCFIYSIIILFIEKKNALPRRRKPPSAKLSLASQLKMAQNSSANLLTR